jgi:hypothetical protein
LLELAQALALALAQALALAWTKALALAQVLAMALDAPALGMSALAQAQAPVLA